MKKYPEGRFMVTGFEARHARQGEIWVEEAICHACGYHKPCVRIDSSDDEYGPGSICLNCTVHALCQPGLPWTQRGGPGLCVACGHLEEEHDGYGGLCDGDMDPETRTMCGCHKFERGDSP